MEQMAVEFMFVGSEANTQAIGVDLAGILVRSNLAGTKSEARRRIVSGAVRINDQQVFDPFARLVMNEEGQFVVVQREKPSKAFEVDP